MKKRNRAVRSLAGSDGLKTDLLSSCSLFRLFTSYPNVDKLSTVKDCDAAIQPFGAMDTDSVMSIRLELSR